MKTKVVVPWHAEQQVASFCDQWEISQDDHRVLFQQDKAKEGCAKTKNKGIQAAKDDGAEVVIVLDDDCFPVDGQSIDEFIALHCEALEPQPVEMFAAVTVPSSRGTPYINRTIKMPVAASMGFWLGVGDYDAPSQLVHGATTEMQFRREAVFGVYFALCGMNLAFRVDDLPACGFVDVPRFDDIWLGFLWQKQAYAAGQCFNLNGPLVTHSRQSNVWANLRDEARYLERNETLWKDIYAASNNERAAQIVTDSLRE